MSYPLRFDMLSVSNVLMKKSIKCPLWFDMPSVSNALLRNLLITLSVSRVFLRNLFTIYLGLMCSLFLAFL